MSPRNAALVSARIVCVSVKSMSVRMPNSLSRRISPFCAAPPHPEELVLRAKELGLVGIGIADRNSVAGVVRAHCE